MIMLPKPARVLVIILNYRTAPMTLRAADAALHDMPKGAELVIVDNASGDGSAEVLQQAITDRGWDEDVRFVASPVNGGFGAGNNIGLRMAMRDGQAAEYFYVLNSDAFPDPGCLPALIEFLDRTPKAGMVASHVRGEDEVEHRTAFRFPTVASELEAAARTGPISRLLRHSIIAPDIPTEPSQMDWVAGASLLMRASMLEDIGLFDETFFLYFEETDLCKRAANAGWERWYLPQARVVHIGSVSTGMKVRQRMPAYWFASRRHYFVKNHGRAYAAAAFVAHVAGGCIHRLRCIISGQTPQDPPEFLRDLIRHGLGLPRRAARSVTGTAPSKESP